MPVKARRIEPAKVVHDFAVEGSGEFPIDMLRYDRCWPAAEAQVPYLTASRSGRRHVLLTGLQEPTQARWQSFGWRVL